MVHFEVFLGNDKSKICSSDNSLCEFLNKIMEYTPCRYEIFPFVFWLVFGISILGVYCSILECMHIYSNFNCVAHMSRPRQYYVLNHEVLRKARLLGALTMSSVWILLVYGLISVKQLFMWPWLVVNILTLIVDFAIWFFDVLTGRLKCHMKDLYPMCCIFCTIALINFVRGFFDNAISIKLMDALKFYDLYQEQQQQILFNLKWMWKVTKWNGLSLKWWRHYLIKLPVSFPFILARTHITSSGGHRASCMHLN